MSEASATLGYLKFQNVPALKGRQNSVSSAALSGLTIKMAVRYPGLKPWAILSSPLRGHTVSFTGLLQKIMLILPFTNVLSGAIYYWPRKIYYSSSKFYGSLFSIDH
ncbi:MAG TPA: hypothetical protein VGO50_05875 [Pyrinomonadaceae bacterium]|nr:hypothetical protein [Pyrinomonadaceae bacterium]